MSKLKYTKGPWISHGLNVDSPLDNTPPICAMIDEGRSIKETLHNAYLVAHAPDMFEALITISNISHGDPSISASRAKRTIKGLL